MKTTVTQALAVTLVDESQQKERPSPRSTAALPDIGDVVGQHYQLTRLLGEGMFGKVYVAQRLDVPEHQVALKLLRRSLYAGRNVERELVMLAAAGHPHVVQLKDHGWTEDYVWLTMPVYHGETLAERLERGPLSLRAAYDIFLAIGHGLEALHQAGLRHQDIKPENIFLAVFAGRVHPILLDLGVAAEKEATFVAGTALYASPEQLLAFTGVPGAVPLTERMDTYCLASTLLYALLGPDGFPGEKAKSRDDIAAAHEVRATRPIPDECLPELVDPPRALLQAAFCRWLALDPTDRPTMSEMCRELDVLLEPEREAAREEARRREDQRTALWRFRVIVGFMLVAGLGVLGYGFSKRETLRLAGELEQARQRGAEQFDKLDLCVASHKIARAEEAACRRAREIDRAEFKATLDGIAKNGDGADAEHARQLQTLTSSWSGRLRACEEESAASATSLRSERERFEKEKAALMSERDEAQTAAEQRAEERDRCLTERNVCLEQRDACKTGGDPYTSPPKPAPPPLFPAPSATPSALPPPATVTPAATAAPEEKEEPY